MTALYRKISVFTLRNPCERQSNIKTFIKMAVRVLVAFFFPVWPKNTGKQFKMLDCFLPTLCAQEFLGRNIIAVVNVNLGLWLFANILWFSL